MVESSKYPYSALNVGHGMADDHMHLAVASDGTLYAAVKTSYDKSGYPKMALLVRRPNGAWDDLYEVDGNGTRPVIVLDEAAGKLIIAYESKEGGGDILYRESPLGTIDLSPVQIMISGKLANVTTSKVTSNGEIVFLASTKSVLFEFDAPAPPVVQSLAVSSSVIDSSTSSPTEISFQDGLFPNVAYVGTSDTQISSGSATTNYGTSQTLAVDGSQDTAALLKWDVSAIPTGSVVVSAAIELNVTIATAQNYEAYALQRAWDELSATWQQFASGQNWSGAGAGGPGDHGAVVLGELGPASQGSYRINLNDAGIAAVQAWINDRNSNYGIILTNYLASEVAGISSGEATVASLRPKLTINYTVPVPVAV